MVSEIVYLNLLLVLARVSSFFFASPLFSIRNVPKAAKLVIALGVTIIVSMTTPVEQIEPSGLIQFGGMIIREALMGVVLGYSVNIMFLGIQSAGEFIDVFAGLQMSSSYDPITGTNGTFYSNVYNWIAMLVFFNMDGHHYLITGIVNSFLFLPVGENVLFELDINIVTNLLVKTFYISVQLGFPIAVILFLIDVILGTISRVVPQINVFILGMPVKLLVSAILFILMITGVLNGISWGIGLVVEMFDMMVKSII